MARKKVLNVLAEQVRNKKELEHSNLERLEYAMVLTTNEETMMKIAYELSTTKNEEMYKLQQTIVSMVGIKKYNEWIEDYDEEYHK